MSEQNKQTTSAPVEHVVNRRLERENRIELVNQFIKTMGEHGRRFFYNERNDQYARMELDGRERCWFVDDYTGERIYTHYPYRWRRFSHGGTMRELVKAFRDFVISGTLLPSHAFGPWPEWYCSGDLWGYGEAMEPVREKAVELGLVASD